jgi:hypothetical protein
MVSEKDKEQEELESAFKVTDRRQFTAEGEKRPSAPEKISEKPSEEPVKAEDSPDVATASEKPSGEPAKVDDSPDVATASEKPPETIDFAQFVYSLATTTMVHLGEIAEPTTGQKMENLEAARQMIDILSILQEKTEGNLTSDESKLLEGLLYELRMKFVSKNKAVDL